MDIRGKEESGKSRRSASRGCTSGLLLRVEALDMERLFLHLPLSGTLDLSNTPPVELDTLEEMTESGRGAVPSYTTFGRTGWTYDKELVRSSSRW